jgi:drug/metabolite transporter (DMT)-like permease
MGSVSAPLLAGFGIALATLVISGAENFRYVSATLFLLVGATLALVTSVQFTFRTRQFAATPPDIEAWWPDHDRPERRETLRREQRYHRREYDTWASRARWAYNVGLVCFLLGVAALLVPPSSPHHNIPNGRLAVIALALAATFAEICWIIYTEWEAKQPPRDWPPVPAPEL